MTKGAIAIQARMRGRQARGVKPAAARSWRFQKKHVRVLDTAGSDFTRFYVQQHEVLEISSVTGTGQLLLTASDAQGVQVVAGGIVYDSAAHAFLKAAQPATSAPLWSAPGEYLYELRLVSAERSVASTMTVRRITHPPPAYPPRAYVF